MPEEEKKEEPVRIVLTPEQREVVRRLSGQHVEALELEPEPELEPARPTDPPKQPGGVLRFRWRLSAATGIPRQAWLPDEEDPKAKPEGS
jgi:hypothetical protein